MGKKAVILLAIGFEEIEAVTVIDILRRAGIEIIIAGLDGINITGSHGITITADKKLSDLKPDFDVVVIPGGMPGALHLHNSSEVNNFIKNMHSKGALIAGICAAPNVVMTPIGLLMKLFGKDILKKGESRFALRRNPKTLCGNLYILFRHIFYLW